MRKLQTSPLPRSDCNVVSGKIVWRNRPLYSSLNASNYFQIYDRLLKRLSPLLHPKKFLLLCQSVPLALHTYLMSHKARIISISRTLRNMYKLQILSQLFTFVREGETEFYQLFENAEREKC